MINFPVPYEDELFYSVMARARVRYCVVSPKALIGHAMGSRSATATVNFPSRLANTCNLNSLSLPSFEQLVYRHTMFPLFAPFMPEERKQNCLLRLQDKSHGAVHMCTGYASSRVPVHRSLRACSRCAETQKQMFGEPYWVRTHQIVGLDNCPIHRTPLIELLPGQSLNKRHEFVPLSLLNIPSCPENNQKTFPALIWLEKQLTNLLHLGPLKSPAFSDWTAYYRELAVKSKVTKGEYIDYEEVKTSVLDSWPHVWLRSFNLYPDDAQSCWLHGITRKHRKAFSYLEHFITIYALTKGAIDVESVFEEIASHENRPIIEISRRPKASNRSICREKKILWLALVKNKGTKEARVNGGAALYIWLYRHCNEWLLKINKRYKRRIPIINNRVNWKKRDIDIVKTLIAIRDSSEGELKNPLQSSNWYLSKLDRGTTITKQLKKLPLTSEFLSRYAETTAEYQMRRLALAISNAKGQVIRRWQLLRNAGLSDERATNLTKNFLNHLEQTGVVVRKNKIFNIMV